MVKIMGIYLLLNFLEMNFSQKHVDQSKTSGTVIGQQK